METFAGTNNVPKRNISTYEIHRCTDAFGILSETKWRNARVKAFKKRGACQIRSGNPNSNRNGKLNATQLLIVAVASQNSFPNYFN